MYLHRDDILICPIPEKYNINYKNLNIAFALYKILDNNILKLKKTTLEELCCTYNSSFRKPYVHDAIEIKNKIKEMIRNFLSTFTPTHYLVDNFIIDERLDKGTKSFTRKINKFIKNKILESLIKNNDININENKISSLKLNNWFSMYLTPRYNNRGIRFSVRTYLDSDCIYDWIKEYIDDEYIQEEELTNIIDIYNKKLCFDFTLMIHKEILKHDSISTISYNNFDSSSGINNTIIIDFDKIIIRSKNYTTMKEISLNDILSNNIDNDCNSIEFYIKDDLVDKIKLVKNVIPFICFKKCIPPTRNYIIENSNSFNNCDG